MISRFLFAILICLLCNSFAHCQTDDSAISYSGYGMVRTNINVQYDHNWGHVSDGFGARVSYKFLSKPSYSLSANFKYNSVTTNFTHDDLAGEYMPNEIGINDIHTIEHLGLTATARTRLFGKPLVGTCIISSEWGIGGFNRLSGTALALIMLKANRNTQFGVGPLLLINTTSKLPLFPVFIYSHRFNKRWTVSLYGGIFGVNFTPTPNDLFSAGADIDVKSFYFKPNAEALPTTCRYTQTSFRPMLKYRHRLTANLYLELQGGIAIDMASRITGVNGTKEYLRIHQKNAPFIQAAVSYSL